MINKISENDFKNSVSVLSDVFKKKGIVLGDDLTQRMGDVIKSFMQEECIIDIYQSELTESKENECFEMEFDIVSGSAIQSIEVIDKNYTEETIIEGLQKGDILTTLSKDDEESFIVLNDKEFKKIAIIKSQRIDGEYEDYS